MTRFATLEEIQALVWNGDYEWPEGAVALHRYRYHKTPLGARRTRELISYAVTLYSARKKVDVQADFESLVPDLVSRIADLFDQKNADGLDVVSTHLAWWATLRGVPVFVQIWCDYAAIEACELGLELTAREPDTAHTRTLILLTYASLLHRRGGERKLRKKYLAEATWRACYIVNPNQQARIYRRLAHAYVFGNRNLLGFWFLYKARGVRGIAADVQDKNKF